ncbi:olfactory receptor 5G9-like [Lissotriton helveticus]
MMQTSRCVRYFLVRLALTGYCELLVDVEEETALEYRVLTDPLHRYVVSQIDMALRKNNYKRKKGEEDFLHLQKPLFVTFLIIYLIILIGNLIILATICYNSRLHTPMYFFLANLSFLDITYTSTTFPKMLVNFFLLKTPVSLTACLVQLYFFMCFACVEFTLLTAMAYDRYVAICIPLRYMVIMNKVTCLQLSAGAWIVGFLDPIAHTVLFSQLSFCGPNEINHFFCDITSILRLSCSSTHIIETLTYVIASVVLLNMFVLTLTSYIYIISAILKIRSSDGRRKTFSTCTSHLTVVLLLYGAISIMYVRPRSTYSQNYNKIYSLLYIALVPLCNPFIYSLKNKELKNFLTLKGLQRVKLMT